MFLYPLEGQFRRDHNARTKNQAVQYGMRIRLMAAALTCLLVRISTAQHAATLFLKETAYDPLPSPDGKHVAFVLTGRRQSGGTGGFGRSNLRSQIGFANASGTLIQDTTADGFLSGWVQDGSAVVSYRDWRFALVGLEGEKKNSGSMAEREDLSAPQPAERVAYVSTRKTFTWITHAKGTSLLQTPVGPLATFKGLLPLSGLIISSPDGRYLIVGGPTPYKWESHDLWVFDTQNRTWADLGPLTVHPDPDWDYIKPSWNPWFADGKRIAFFSGKTLCIASPDGRERQTLLKADDAGLAVPSKDGHTIAYVSFTKRSRKNQPDHSFWGGSTIWVVPSAGGTPHQITAATEDETFSLNWLNRSTLIFDRIGETMFSEDARIWTVPTDGP